MLAGPDVSNWQGSVDWPQLRLRNGHELAFAVAKATEGTRFVDQDFGRNWHGIRARKLVRGAYHFACPGLSSASAEAAHYLAVVHSVGGIHAGDLPPILDLEKAWGLSSAEIYQWTAEWVRIVRHETGRVPMIYTGGFWKSYLNHYTDAWDCPLWIAQYAAKPELPAAWKHWTLWQCTDRAPVEGIAKGVVDLSFFNGSHAELEAFAGGRSVGPDGWEGRVLSHGVRGEDVRRWQKRMRERGFTHVQVNGHYDEDSARACRWLQLYLRYPPTEDVDERVWEATFKAA
jgi:GH25 family lysozyme M1 (1,4-beta-N-acetylmuramidase)